MQYCMYTIVYMLLHHELMLLFKYPVVLSVCALIAAQLDWLCLLQGCCAVWILELRD